MSSYILPWTAPAHHHTTHFLSLQLFPLSSQCKLSSRSTKITMQLSLRNSLQQLLLHLKMMALFLLASLTFQEPCLQWAVPQLYPLHCKMSQAFQKQVTCGVSLFVNSIIHFAYETQALVREESQHLCGVVQYKMMVKHQAGHSVQQHKYRLPAPGSLDVPYSPDWSRAMSFSVNRAFFNAVVDAAWGLPVIIL